MMENGSKAYAVAILLMGLMLLFLGGATLVHPEKMTRYGLIVSTPEARIAVRAIFGGSEVALGLLLLFGHLIGFSQYHRLAIATLLFCSIVSVRMVAMVLEQQNDLPPIVYRELIVEIFIVLALLVTFFIGRKRQR